MTAHHQAAIEMAALAKQEADHAEIRTLADDIISAQENEITTMKHIADDLPGRETGGGGHMGMSDAGMGMDTDPAMLNDAEPFDRAFIDMVVPHHEGAVVMAEQLLEDGEHHNMRAMAQEIISAQTREIAQMKRWRHAWYGSARVPTDMSGHGSTDDVQMGG